MKRLLNRLKRVLRMFIATKGGTHASSIAYYVFMSMIPMMVIFAALVPVTGITAEEVINAFLKIFPAGTGEVIEVVVKEAFENGSVALSVSLIALLWTASRGITAIINGLNDMYGAKEERGFVKIIVISVVFVFIFILFLSALTYLIFSGGILTFLSRFFPGIRIRGPVVTFLNFIVVLVIGILSFELMYTFLPSGKRKFAAQFPGAFLASSFWFVCSVGFRIYMNHSNTITRFYGSFATIALFMLWMYCIFYILLAGAFINCHFEELIPSRIKTFLDTNRKTAVFAAVLFLLGFLGFLSSEFLYLQFGSRPTMVPLQLAMKCITQISVFVTLMVIGKCTGIRVRSFWWAALFALCAGYFLLLTPNVLRNIYLLLVLMAVWYVVSLLIGAQMVLGEGEKSAP